MKRAGIARAGGRLFIGGGFAVIGLLGPVGAALAGPATTTTTTTTTTAPGSDSEAYPPVATGGSVTPTTAVIPKTGNDGTETWLRLGAGAMLAGGVMMAGASRRRRGAEA